MNLDRPNVTRPWVSWILFLMVVWLPATVFAAGGKPATKLVAVADTRNVTGLARWIGQVYNENLWLFAALVVGVMVLMGLVLGTLFDRVLVMMGLNLGKLDHHE